MSNTFRASLLRSAIKIVCAATVSNDARAVDILRHLVEWHDQISESPFLTERENCQPDGQGPQGDPK